ncbi:porin family protein [Rufibacter latericius]|uniref:porin family protein n=1 Tax=Rufibacter latericius TaxID=2487040 RepID=UPI001404170F|nr:porin family protein [Rufibacter latericius]
MINLVVRYNQCSNPASLTYVETPTKSIFTWGIVAGGSTSTLQVKGGPSIQNQDQRLTSSFVPAVGLFVNSTLPWINPKLSLQVELQYTRNQYAKSFSEQVNTFRRDYDLALDLHYVKLPILARYSFPIKKINPFLSAGFINSYAVKFTQELTTTSSNSVQENTSVKKESYMEDFRKYAQSFAVGGGVLFPISSNHQLSVEGRYEKGNGFSKITTIGTTTDQFYFLLGISF